MMLTGFITKTPDGEKASFIEDEKFKRILNILGDKPETVSKFFIPKILNKWIRLSVQGIYLLSVITVFGGFTGHREISEIHQITWIPIVEYTLVFVILIFGEIIFKVKSSLK